MPATSEFRLFVHTYNTKRTNVRARPVECVIVLVHAYLLSTTYLPLPLKKKKIPFDGIFTYMLGFLITLCMFILSLSLSLLPKKKKKPCLRKKDLEGNIKTEEWKKGREDLCICSTHTPTP